MKIAIVMPSHEYVPFTFTVDLASLVAFTMASMPEGVTFGIVGKCGTYIHDTRQSLLTDALRDDCDYILWLDTDMRFPPDAFERLMGRHKDIVGINYAKRGLPTSFVALKTVPEGETKGTTCLTLPDSTGLEEVEGLGFGMVLMRTAALSGMPDPAHEPWFQNVHLGENRWMGEDIFFCKLFREHTGRKIFVDQDLSKECAHTGAFEYRPEHAAIELAEAQQESKIEVVR